MITDTNPVPPITNVPDKKESDDQMRHVRRRSRSGNMSSSPRRCEKSDVALNEQQAIMMDGLQMQFNRLQFLGKLARRSSDRQTRLEDTVADIAGAIKTVMTKMDLMQQHQREALSQHEKALRNQHPEQEKLKMMTGRTAQMQQKTLDANYLLKKSWRKLSKCYSKRRNNDRQHNKFWRQGNWRRNRERRRYNRHCSDRQLALMNLCLH